MKLFFKKDEIGNITIQLQKGTAVIPMFKLEVQFVKSVNCTFK